MIALFKEANISSGNCCHARCQGNCTEAVFKVGNFIFQNGFSGHGLQQSPAMGRGVSELITYGEYRSLDLSPFSWSRIVENRPIVETAVI